MLFLTSKNMYLKELKYFLVERRTLLFHKATTHSKILCISFCTENNSCFLSIHPIYEETAF